MNRRGRLCAMLLLASGCVEREYSSANASGRPDSGDVSDTLDAPPACLEAAEESFGIFVSPSGVDDPSCGAEAAPCATLQEGVARAVETGLAYVFPTPGSYPGSVALARGVTIVGGWNNVGGTWRRLCPGDPALVQVLGGDVAITATDLNGAAGLDSVTITSRAADLNGRSTYGLVATGASSELSLRNVVIAAGNGTQGANGSPPLAAGAPKAAGSCDASLAAAGASGPPGANGTGSSAGFFDQDGYHPGDGADGESGMLGGNGSVNSDYATSDSCSDCVATGSGASLQCNLSPPSYATGYPGKPGCGGQGGPGGGGGRGGGSSIALFVFDAQVTITASSLTAGDGGAGGEAAWGAAGGSPSSGITGDARKCYSDCQLRPCFPPPCIPSSTPCIGVGTTLSGGSATSGGAGGQGGQGSGGAGGWSVALVALGTAHVLMNGTELHHGMAGAGGVASTPGQPGIELDFYP